MGTIKVAKEILSTFEKNVDYIWLSKHIDTLTDTIRKDYHVDSLLYYVSSLRDALHKNSDDLSYYRHCDCYLEIFHDIRLKLDTFSSECELPIASVKKSPQKKCVSDEKVETIYADAIKDINSMQMNIFDFLT